MNTLTPLRRAWFSSALGLALVTGATASLAQTFPNYPITPGQRSTAQQVARAGVPLSELAPNAPDRYTIQRGDTLWDISAMYLIKPWRWPELWGMNMAQIRNPHLIFPGQVLVLTKVGDRAFLSLGDAADLPTVKLSPQVRAEALDDSAIPPIPLSLIEPFLTESLLVDEATHARAPRITATPENRVLLSRGDRAYARGQYGHEGTATGQALSMAPGSPRQLGIYRNAVPLLDPQTQELLGYEAQFIGQARLVRGESHAATPGNPGSATPDVVPATIDITLSKEEIRVGDRLLPQTLRDVPRYVPSAPASAIDGRIVKVHGNAVRYAGQNQVVILNRGQRDGLETGHVLALLKDAPRTSDRTDPTQPLMRLPNERNGLMMVFRTFDRVSYALVLEITDGVKVGDHFTQP